MIQSGASDTYILYIHIRDLDMMKFEPGPKLPDEKKSWLASSTFLIRRYEFAPLPADPSSGPVEGNALAEKITGGL